MSHPIVKGVVFSLRFYAIHSVSSEPINTTFMLACIHSFGFCWGAAYRSLGLSALY